MFPQITLQPKQAEVFDLVENGKATWIGMPGGRGGAKSAALQRIMLTRRMMHPGTVGAIVLRNNDQTMRYQVDPMMKTWPMLREHYRSTDKKLVLPVEGGASEIVFTYAESLNDVIRRFRSANFFDVFVDQAEQFTPQELFEIKQAVRWPNVPPGTCKLLLAFNMGGVGIDYLRRVFHLKQYNDNERPEDYAHVHVAPFDNIEWSRPALAEDGYSRECSGKNDCQCQECVFYSWSQEERRAFMAARSDYGRALTAQNSALVKRDWLGSWDSLEGSFFSHAFDRDATVLSAEQAGRLIKPWWERWLAQDWGRGHYCVTYWVARGEVSPEDAKKVLGWEVPRTLKLVVIYREYVAGGAAEEDGSGDRELAEQDIARKIVEMTPEPERKKMAAFFLSPDAFAKRTSHNTIAHDMGGILSAAGMPFPRRADNDRIGGWALMSNMLLEAKRRGATWDNVLLISAECPELIAALPLAMRDPKNLDDILKTTRLGDDCLDAGRYALKSMLSPGQKPDEEVVRDKVEAMKQAGLDDNSVYIHRTRLLQQMAEKHKPIVIGRGHRRPSPPNRSL